MADIIKGMEFLKIPATIAVILIGQFLLLQIIGEFCEFKGKVVPEFLKIRKYFHRKKEAKVKQKELLADVQATLTEIKSHYSPEKIAQRDQWMKWVNDRAKIYDESVAELTALKTALDANNELVLDLYINVNRNRIIDFASKVVNKDIAVSREEFNRIFKVYNSYEEILAKYDKTNGEVDVSMHIIEESYEEHMRNRTFIEDSRGYSK